jgi:hypothetical protein
MRKQQIFVFGFAKYALAWLLNLQILQAQSDLDHLGTWNIVNVKLTLSRHWSIFAEPQLRSLRFYDHFHYYEVKGGVQYTLNPNFSFLAGAGEYHTYQEGGDFVEPQLNDEFRSWLQVTMSQRLNRLKFEHRYRAEQRWPSSGYRNRFRYRLNAVFTLGDEKLKPGDWYLTASNEIFFTDRAPYFERNRFFVGAGYLAREWLTLQAGWMKQFDYRINDETGRNFLQISVLTEFSLKRKAEQ